VEINQSKLGGRLPLLDPETLEGDQKRLYDLLNATLISWAEASGFKGKTQDGKLIGPFNPNLHSPGITPGFLQLLQAESKNTSLDKRTREVVILSVVAVWKSPYALYAHSAIARNLGVPENAIRELVTGRESERLSPKERVAHRFARQLVREFRVEADFYRDAESTFGRSGLVEMLYLIGIYLLTAAVLNAFEIPAPE
jgi:4-carboxymuconolactone decarboxylase